MDERDMETIRNEYCDVAQRLMKSGFDMVMVHAAHGNLLAQFRLPNTISARMNTAAALKTEPAGRSRC